MSPYMVDCTCRDVEMQEAEGQAGQEPEVMLNYDQYYPTMLPLRQPGMEETDAEAHARDDRPPDLSLHQVLIAVLRTHQHSADHATYMQADAMVIESCLTIAHIVWNSCLALELLCK